LDGEHGLPEGKRFCQGTSRKETTGWDSSIKNNLKEIGWNGLDCLHIWKGGGVL